jgi:hypothetical protein
MFHWSVNTLYFTQHKSRKFGHLVECDISGFRHGVVEVLIFLECFTAYVESCLPTFRTILLVPPWAGCPEKSVMPREARNRLYLAVVIINQKNGIIRSTWVCTVQLKRKLILCSQDICYMYVFKHPVQCYATTKRKISTVSCLSLRSSFPTTLNVD